MRRTMVLPRILTGLLPMLAAGVLFTWSYFRASLQEVYPTWSMNDLSIIFTVHNITVGICNLLAGQFVKKMIPRVSLAIGGFFLGLGLFLMSFLPADPDAAHIMAIICYGVMSPIGVSVVSLTTTNTCPGWSEKHTGLICGILMLGFGICSFGYGALSSVLIPSIGIFGTFRVIGIILWCLVGIGLPLMRHPTPADNLPPVPPRAENKAQKNYTTKEATCTVLFWGIFIFNIFLRGSGLMFADHAAPIASAFGAAALLGLLYAPANASAQIICGVLFDYLGFRKTIRLIIFIQLSGCACLFIGALTNVMFLIIIGLVCGGFSYGGATSVAVNGSKILFGPKHFTSTYGILSIGTILASFLGNLGSVAVEWLGGSYYGVFSLCSIYGLLGFGAVFIISLAIKQRETEKIAEI